MIWVVFEVDMFMTCFGECACVCVVSIVRYLYFVVFCAVFWGNVI
jgi:hypothetical protein